MCTTVFMAMGLRRRVLLLINAKSRKGRESAESIRTRLEALGLEIVNGVDIPCPEFAREIERHAGRIDCAVVGGGDGSMSAALPGLLTTGVPLAIVPLGTSNNLARNLGIPVDLEEACAAIPEGENRRIDVGWVNEIPFFNVAGMGLSIRVNREVPPESKRRFGMLAYAMTAVRLWRELHPFKAEIRAGSSSLCARAHQISVCNGRHFGSGLVVSEEATISDGLLHLYSVQADGWMDVGRIAASAWTGRHREKSPLLLVKGSELEIRTRKPMEIDVDGEIRTRTPARFRVDRDAVTVVIPKATAPGLFAPAAAAKDSSGRSLG
jgi:YegS/Rv2252/BmrU family lipid kinase